MLATIYKEGHFHNSLFEEEDVTHKYNPLSGDIYLRNAFKTHGVEVNTPDLNQGRMVDFEIYIEAQPPSAANMKKFLISMENPYHNTHSHSGAILDLYEAIFSWDRGFLGGRSNYFFSNIPHPMILSEKPLFFKKRERFICLINANKSFKYSVDSDLYVERYKTIKWFEKNTRNLFDLYGIGWNKPYSGCGLLQKQYRNYLSLKTKITKKPAFSSYRGEVSSKRIYLEYQFAVCYENVSDLPYYITEKILDAMSYGCIPIYWGAPNIKEIIPSDCYIDRRDFSNNRELYEYLASMSAVEIDFRRRAIWDYMDGLGKKQFAYKSTISSIVNSITTIMKNG